ncbi:hypothetical protein [Spirosoma utsteinense]|uniref:hypothetical protein n=1 Tax=Spirosoma utsteinense TaxID=2585773 RepID=UPI0016495C4E|nr:hypothetical protein [Spirosoma utsteinense]MBC3785746.1 hypothetical protein [Spirosoma utsteinense]
MPTSATTQASISQILTLNNIGGWTKKDLTELAKASVDDVAENGQDTLALLALAAKLEHFAGEVKKSAKGRGVADLAKYGKGAVAISGVKLQIKETGVSYDYSADPVWVSLNVQLEHAKDNLAAQEKTLKGLPYEGKMMVDEVTGDLYRAYPPAKSAKESIQATIL